MTSLHPKILKNSSADLKEQWSAVRTGKDDISKVGEYTAWAGKNQTLNVWNGCGSENGGNSTNRRANMINGTEASATHRTIHCNVCVIPRGHWWWCSDLSMTAAGAPHHDVSVISRSFATCKLPLPLGVLTCDISMARNKWRRPCNSARGSKKVNGSTSLRTISRGRRNWSLTKGKYRLPPSTSFSVTSEWGSAHPISALSVRWHAISANLC